MYLKLRRKVFSGIWLQASAFSGIWLRANVFSGIWLRANAFGQKFFRVSEWAGTLKFTFQKFALKFFLNFHKFVVDCEGNLFFYH